MSQISKMLSTYPVPKVAKVRQTFNNDLLEDVEGTLWKGLEENCAPIAPGARIAITCGSRGIDQYVLIIKTIVRFVKEKGGIPFLVPSMGSHGGATAEGQIEVLKGYGITEESMGAEINACMDVTDIGTISDGTHVFVASHLLDADAIIIMNRIKAHPGFSGPIESGLTKMAVIGFGKRAAYWHVVDVFMKIDEPKGFDQNYLIFVGLMAVAFIIGEVAIYLRKPGQQKA